MNYFSVSKLNSAAFSILTLILSGCMETASDLNAVRPKPTMQQILAPNIPVSLISVDGLPVSKNQQLNELLLEEAKQRNVILTMESGQPRFKIKGYMSAYTVEGGTVMSWVWDMYDTHLQRAQRLGSSTLIKRNHIDPWSVVDDATLKIVASNSMNEIAAYLASAKDELLQDLKKRPEKIIPDNQISRNSIPQNQNVPKTRPALTHSLHSTGFSKFSALDLKH